jgi:hypothetical protein
MLAATGSLPEMTLVYFAVAQLPIYLSPLMLKPLAAAVVHAKLRLDAPSG